MGLIFDSIYLALLFLCYLYLIILAINKANGWQLLEIKDEELPFVSVVIPTLDEENNIGRCLDSIMALDYPNREIILVDGGSKDNTIEIAEKYPIRIIVDPNLPEGWVGKSYGCHVAYLATKGEVLLFTDADTVHTPQSLKIAVSNLKGTNASLLSIYPYQICEKWYEYFISYFYFLSYLAGGPRKDINNPYNKQAFMASGQYMLFTREGYETIGGHLSVSNSLVEDLALSKQIKKHELGLNFIDRTKLITTRMYPDKFGDLFRAFRRNIWGGLVTISLWRIFFLVLWVVYFALAPYFMIQSFFNRADWLSLADFSIGIIVNSAAYFAYSLSIWLYWRKRGMGKWYYYVFFPFVMFLDFIIILVSLFYGFQGRKVSWKGRFYSTKGSGFKARKKEKIEVEKKEVIDKEVVTKQ